MRLDEKLRKLIRKHHSSQDKLAQVIGVSQNLVSLWCRGKNIPDIKEAAAIAKAFCVDVNYLADDTLDEPPVEPSRSFEERHILQIVHDLRLDPDEAVRRLTLQPSVMPRDISRPSGEPEKGVR